MNNEARLLELKRRHSARLLALPGVCGVGVEKDEHGNYVLAVHLDPANPKSGEAVPDTLEGYTVKKIRSGPFSRF